MFSTTFKRARAAVAAVAIASMLVVPGAFAHVGTVGSPAQVAPPPSSIAASAAEEYEALRSQGEPQATTTSVASEPSGFDCVSAAIGAAAAGALSLLLMATVGTRLPIGRRAEGV